MIGKGRGSWVCGMSSTCGSCGPCRYGPGFVVRNAFDRKSIKTGHTPFKVAFAAWLALALGFLEPPVHQSCQQAFPMAAASFNREIASSIDRSHRALVPTDESFIPCQLQLLSVQDTCFSMNGVVPFGFTVGGAISSVVVPKEVVVEVVVQSWRSEKSQLSDLDAVVQPGSIVRQEFFHAKG